MLLTGRVPELYERFEDAEGALNSAKEGAV